MKSPLSARWSRTCVAALMAAGVSFGTVVSTTAQAGSHGGKAKTDDVAEGKKIAFDRKKGNCLACHAMGDGVSPGNIGPVLVAMKQRFPDKAKLRTQIHDPAKANPDTRMPPFGVHKILSDKDIDKIVAYIYTL